MSMSMPDCYRCKHFRGASPDDPPTCAAFPEEIPEEIFVGLRTSADSDARTRVRHTSPYEGDHGFRFEAKSEARDDLVGIQVRISAAGHPFHPGHSPGVGPHGGASHGGGGVSGSTSSHTSDGSGGDSTKAAGEALATHHLNQAERHADEARGHMQQATHHAEHLNLDQAQYHATMAAHAAQEAQKHAAEATKHGDEDHDFLGSHHANEAGQHAEIAAKRVVEGHKEMQRLHDEADMRVDKATHAQRQQAEKDHSDAVAMPPDDDSAAG